MAIAQDKICVSSSSSHMEFSTDVFADRVQSLISETVLNYTLNRVFHLNDVLSTVGKKCTSRAFDIFNFPFSDVKRMVHVFRGQRCSTALEDNEIDGELFTEMNRECLQRHLSAFALELDQVPGDGDCCFVSTVFTRISAAALI